MENQHNNLPSRVNTHLDGNSKFGREITLTHKDVDVISVIMDINLILPYPLNDAQLERWASTINRLRPDWEVEKLERIVDSFISGDREWQINKGISNIFLADSKSTLNF